MTSQGTNTSRLWVGGFAVTPADPPAPEGRSTADVLLSTYLAQADLVIEALKRAPLLVRYHQARHVPGISAADWVLGLAGWSLALYGVVVDVDSARLDPAELLSAEGRVSAAALIAVARRRLAMGLDFDGLALDLAADPLWSKRAIANWDHERVIGRRARALGEPRLAAGPAALEVGRSGVGRMVLGQSAILAESADPSIAEVYASLRRLAVSLAKGASTLPVLGGAVIPALKQVLARQTEHAVAAPFRASSVNGR